MLTGCYPPRIGFEGVLFPGSAIGLDPREQTIAKQLKQKGYATHHVGKWHCGDQPEFLPTRHGFDGYLGIPYSNDMGRQAGRPVEKQLPPLPLVRDEHVLEEQPDQRSITERYTYESTEFIRKNAAEGKPFFLYLAHMYVHVPLFVPKQFLEKSRNGGYGGAVACIDWSTGVLMDTLKQLGIENNTLVIFTSDNGSRARDEGGSNGPCRGHKAQTWEGGQRVACIMRWPDKIKPGSTCSEVTRSIDLFPTLSAIVGAKNPNAATRPIDGVDIRSLMFSEAKPAPNDTFCYYRGFTLEAVRRGDWKLHFRKGDEVQAELYNLRTDVGETRNVYDANPAVVKDLTAFADSMRAELGDRATGIEGKANRPIGKVENAKPLTQYREDHPYIIAMYDLPDMPTMAG
jgi:arylsulfatase A-like enzyme